ncbi:hypothetical protein KI387_036894, partial [Taxus chinensis]
YPKNGKNDEKAAQAKKKDDSSCTFFGDWEDHASMIPPKFVVVPRDLDVAVTIVTPKANSLTDEVYVNYCCDEVGLRHDWFKYGLRFKVYGLGLRGLNGSLEEKLKLADLYTKVLVYVNYCCDEVGLRHDWFKY